MATRKRSTYVKSQSGRATVARELYPIHAHVCQLLTRYRDTRRATIWLAQFAHETGARRVDFHLAADAIDVFAIGLDHGLGV